MLQPLPGRAPAPIGGGVFDAGEGARGFCWGGRLVALEKETAPSMPLPARIRSRGMERGGMAGVLFGGQAPWSIISA